MYRLKSSCTPPGKPLLSLGGTALDDREQTGTFTLEERHQTICRGKSIVVLRKEAGIVLGTGDQLERLLLWSREDIMRTEQRQWH